MTSVTFDALHAVQKLRSAGIDDKQAEAIAETVKDSFNARDLVTKQGMKAALVGLEYRLAVKIGALVVVCAGIIGAWVKLF